MQGFPSREVFTGDIEQGPSNPFNVQAVADEVIPSGGPLSIAICNLVIPAPAPVIYFGLQFVAFSQAGAPAVTIQYQTIDFLKQQTPVVRFNHLFAVAEGPSPPVLSYAQAQPGRVYHQFYCGNPLTNANGLDYPTATWSQYPSLTSGVPFRYYPITFDFDQIVITQAANAASGGARNIIVASAFTL